MKTNQEIAREVIQGKWGNGEERKRRLTNEGYSYKDVQSIVNVLMKDPNAVKEIKSQEYKFKVTGTEILEVEIDLTKYKGIELIFVTDNKEKFDESLLEGWD